MISTAGPPTSAWRGSAGAGAPGARSAPGSEGDTSGVAQRVSSSRFIGRRPELAELDRLLRAAADGGKPSMVFVAGESGVGKTRLLGEVIAATEALGGRAMGGACIELGEDELPYAPLVAAVRPLQRSGDPVLDELPPVTRAELSRLIPELGEPPGEPEAERGEAQRRLFDALLELIAILGAEHPVLLWIEDIHWADRSTRSFLRFLSANLTEERALVLTTYRSDELHRRHPVRPLLAEIERSPCSERIELERFDRGELADQLADILGAAPPRDIVERMYGRSEGNPLFTEELLAAGVDARAPLPPSLREALLLRVERLPAETQRLLGVLAVAGRASDALLADAGGVDPAELTTMMREAIAAQIVVVSESGRYGFRHALLREVLYDDLLPGERAELHLTLAHALERAAAEGDGAWQATGIAHHYYSAGDQPRALTAALSAARAVQRLHAYGEAAALLDRALELWPRVSDPEELTGVDHAEVLTRAARAHYLAGDEEMGAALYETAADEIDERAEPERAAKVLTALATCQWSLGLADRSRATQRRGLELLPPGEDSPARAALLAQRVRFLLLQGRFRDVRDEAPEALEASQRAGLGRDLGVVNRLGCALFALGDEEGAREHLDESIELALERGTSDDVSTAFLNYADALHLAGQSREAKRVAERGLAEVRAKVGAGASRSMRWIRLNLSEIEFDLGNWAGAEEQLQPIATPYRGVALAHARLREAQLAMGRGEHEDGRRELDQANDLLSNALEPQYIAAVAALRAELERRTGALDCAAAEVDHGIDRIQFCSDDAGRLALVAGTGISVAADVAERARDLGDDAGSGAAVARAESLLELVRGAVDEADRPVEAATLASAEAEFGRARAADDPGSWAAAARAWDEVERPYPQAVARWRQAQAELAGGDRGAAAGSVADAIAIAEGLGAGWLLGEAKGFRARARLSLATPAQADGDGDGDGAEPAEPEPFGLTPRERQVLTLVASGATNREIAGELYMAEKTASVHVSRILGKLDVRSRTEAAAVAHRHGLAARPEPTAPDGAEV